jgi:hypothetical protein
MPSPQGEGDNKSSQMAELSGILQENQISRKYAASIMAYKTFFETSFFI